MVSHVDSDEFEEVEEVVPVRASAADSLPTMDNPLDDTRQLDDAIAQRRGRVASLQTERQAHESQLSSIAAQQKMLAQRQAELQQALKRNETQRNAAVKDLDNLLQTKSRLQSLQQQASLAAAQSRAAMQQRAALTASLRPLMSPQAGPPPAAPATNAPIVAQQAASPLQPNGNPAPSASPASIAAASPPQPAAHSPAAATPPAVAQPMPAQQQMAAPPLSAAPQPLAAQPLHTAPPPRVGPPPLNRSNRTPLAVEVDFTSETNLFVGFSENISEGGLFVATDKPATIGTSIAVAFTLPNQRDPIRCETNVAWSVAVSAERLDQVPGMGLKFVNLSDTDRERLRAFISIREPLFFPG